MTVVPVTVVLQSSKRVIMRKKISSVLMIIAFLTMLSACSKISNPGTEEQFGEWREALKIQEYEDLSVKYVSQNESSIEIGIECKNDETAYESLKNVIENHNTFVDDHPEYFPDEYSIALVSLFPSGKPFLNFYSNSSEDFGKEYMHELVKENDKHIEILYVNIWDIIDKFKDKDFSFDISNLVLMDMNMGDISYDSYSVITSFEGLENIVIDYQYAHGDLKEIYSAIHNYKPGVTVYIEKAGKLERKN